jgi:hypothetical protein
MASPVGGRVIDTLDSNATPYIVNKEYGERCGSVFTYFCMPETIGPSTMSEMGKEPWGSSPITHCAPDIHNVTISSHTEYRQ